MGKRKNADERSGAAIKKSQADAMSALMAKASGGTREDFDRLYAYVGGQGHSVPEFKKAMLEYGRQRREALKDPFNLDLLAQSMANNMTPAFIEGQRKLATQKGVSEAEVSKWVDLQLNMLEKPIDDRLTPTEKMFVANERAVFLHAFNSGCFDSAAAISPRWDQKIRARQEAAKKGPPQI